ncbi:MAG: formylglycine-generating enzyme family protein [Planctomycetes bacterium]|nr:formylglycine-generating enzyme family protein [Planctomycetota bacterium]
MLRILASLLLFISTAAAVAAESEAPGLVAEKPEKGPYVETDRGYMVPYTVKIPGSDVSFEMIPIPGGEARIGSPDDEPGRSDVEGPRFTVQVEPFWMAKTEVSWAEYKEFMKLYTVLKEFQARQVRLVTDENKVDAITVPTALYEPSITFEFGEDPQLPAVTMTQLSAKQYTKWLSGITGEQYRLPTEAEWEYACRAGADTAYSFGSDPVQLDEYAWYADNSDGGPHLVGQKKPNAFGLHDMHGNVWEWVIDEYTEYGYKRFAGKKLKAADAVMWPTKAYPRTVKGGSWDDDASACRCASKMGSHDEEWKSDDPNLPLSPWWFTSDPSRAVGFRIVRPLNKAPREEMARFWEPDVEAIKTDIELRLLEGRGVLGIVDETLIDALQELSEEQ